MYGSTTNAFQIESGPFQIHSLIDGRNTAMPFKSFVRLRVGLLQLHSYLHQQVLAVVSSAGRCFVVVDSSRRTPPSPHATAFPVFAIVSAPPARRRRRRRRPSRWRAGAGSSPAPRPKGSTSDGRRSAWEKPSGKRASLGSERNSRPRRYGKRCARTRR